MTREEFLALSEDEQAAYILAADTNAKSVTELTAERDSFKTENESLRDKINENEKELKQTKETNYTLVRQLGRELPPADPEQALYDFIKERN